jgi:hypothetical protein
MRISKLKNDGKKPSFFVNWRRVEDSNLAVTNSFVRTRDTRCSKLISAAGHASPSLTTFETRLRRFESSEAHASSMSFAKQDGKSHRFCKYGGWRIRTSAGLPPPHFECGALDHSANPPLFYCSIYPKI